MGLISSFFAIQEEVTDSSSMDPEVCLAHKFRNNVLKFHGLYKCLESIHTLHNALSTLYVKQQNVSNSLTGGQNL